MRAAAAFVCRVARDGSRFDYRTMRKIDFDAILIPGRGEKAAFGFAWLPAMVFML